MKVNWIALAIVAAVCFFIPGGFLASSGDRSGAGMVAMGYLLFLMPPAMLVAIALQVFMSNTRFRAYPTYALVGILSSALGVMFLA